MNPTLESLEARRLLSVGKLDPAFGVNGVATVQPKAKSLDQVTLFGADGSGFIVGAKGTTKTAGVYELGRFDSSGRPDASFGTDGKREIDLTGKISTLDGAAMASDGSIVLSGPLEDSDFAAIGVQILKINPAGQINSSFGSGGVATFAHSPDQSDNTIFLDHVAAVTFAPDGKLLVLAFEHASEANYDDAILLRLKANGQLDTSFGKAGAVRFKNVGFRGEGTASDLIVLPDGRIYVAAGVLTTGEDRDEDGIPTDFPVYQGILARLHGDGTLDRSFGVDPQNPGIITTDAPQDLEVLPDGTLLLVEAQYVGDNSFDDIGTIETSISAFTRRGRRTRLFSGHSSTQIDFGRSDDRLEGIAREEDGSYIVTVDNGDNRAVGKLKSDFSIDRSFGSSGLITVAGTNPKTSHVIALPDNKALFAFSQPYFAGEKTTLNLVRVDMTAANPDAVDDTPTDTVTFPNLVLDVAGSARNDNIKLAVSPATDPDESGSDQFDITINGKMFGPYFSDAYRQLVIHSGKGNDRITIDGGTLPFVTIYGGAGNDFIRATAQIFGGPGDDVIVGSGFGEAGNDTIYGGESGEANGGGGNDLLQGSNVSGGPGDDTIRGTAGGDRLDGGPGNDRIYGRSGADELDGGEGNDQLFTGGADGSQDTADGGDGVDRFVGESLDTVSNTEFLS